MDTPKIEIKTLGWNMDHPAEKPEDASIGLYSRVFVGGQELPGVHRVRVLAGNDSDGPLGSFTSVQIRLLGAITVETLTQSEWDALGPRV